MKHVLIVSADTDIQQSLCASFEVATPDSRVSTGFSLEDARASLETGGIDLMICDWSLPNEAGTQLLKQLEEADDDLPVLLLATEQEWGDVLTCLDRSSREALLKHPLLLADAPRVASRLVEAWQDRQQLALAECDLSEFQERFDVLTGSSNDFIWEIDENGIYTYVSHQVQTMLGYTLQEVIGQPCLSLMSDEDAPRFSALFESMRKSGLTIRNWQNCVCHKDGHEVFLETSGVPIRDADGQFRGVRGIDRDITERYLAEQVLLRREAILQAVALASQKLLKPSSTVDDVQEVLELLGQAAEVSRMYVFKNSVNEQGELLGSLLYEWTAPEIPSHVNDVEFQQMPYDPDFSRWADELSESRMIHGKVEDCPECERPLLSRLGMLSVMIAPIYVGEVWWGFIGLDDCWTDREWASLEIDAIHTAANLLGAALHRQLWESKLTQMNDCFLRFGPDPMTNINLVTTLCGEVFGATSAYYNRIEGELLCKWGAYHPLAGTEPSPKAGHICLEVINGQEELYIPDLQNTDYADTDGAVREFGLQTYYGRPVKFLDRTVGSLCAVFQYHFQPSDDDRKLMAIMSSAIGVEEDRRNAEDELRRLAITVEQAAEAIAVLSTDGKIEYVNPAFEAASGYTREELIGKELPLFRSALHDKEFYRNIWRTLRKGEPWSNRIANRRKDGSIYHEDAVISPIRDQNERITNFVAVKRDITKELELEEQLRHSQKMESVGRLAGGVAHDFNNLLSVIMGYADMTLSNLPPDHALHDMVMEIRKSGERATALTQQLLAFSRKQVLEVKSVNLNQVIEDTRKMLGRLIGEHIVLQTHLDPGILNIRADVAQLQQILMNLVLNARDAILEEGTIIIETYNEELSTDDPRISPDLEAGDYVVLAVIDTGHGIDEATMQRIFDPFYTTKSRGKGTGLGLATVHGIVKQHRAEILVHSAVGEGTEFQIFFPCEQAGKEIGDTTIEDRVEPHGTETILLVEDDYNVLALAQRVLEKYGYQILPADSAEAALRKVEQYDEPIHLLLSDVIMPRMNGPDLYANLKQILPDLRVLYMSGYTEASLRGRALIDSDHTLINKPFTISALVDSVRLTLDA